MVFRTFHLRKFITSVGLTVLTGVLVGIITSGQYELYGEIIKPPFSPPRAVFPVVWSILYILMGIALYFIRITPDSPQKSQALLFFGLQLFFNFCWPIAFFNFGAFCFAAIWLVVLLVLVGITTYKFFEISSIGGILLLPYLIWCAYATYLNIGVCLLN